MVPASETAFHREGRFLARGGGVSISLYFDESIFELEASNVSPAVLREMPSQGVLPTAKNPLAHETFGSLACDSDMSLAFPLPPEAFVAHAAAPLPSDVVEHGSGLTATRFGGRR